MTHTPFSSLFFAMLAATALTGTAAQAQTLVVDRNDDTTVSNCTAAANDCTLRGAITRANASPTYPTINFAPNVTGTITLSGTALPGFTRDILIQGPSAKALTVSGNNASGILRVLTGNRLDIAGLTLTSGNATTGGMGAQATGGGIDIENNATVFANQIWIKDCKAFGGGAIENFGRLVISNSTFSGNSATAGGGGAIHSVGGTASLSISNSTFFNNRAAGSGGGILSDSASTTLGNLTVVSNLANSNGRGTGGGVAAGGPAFAIRNSIITGNITANATSSSVNDVANVTTDGGFNYVGGSAAAAGLEGSGTSLALKDNGGPTPTIAISANGAAYNAGDPNFNTTTTPNDQRGLGFARKAAGQIDQGAYELQIETASLVVTTNADSLAEDGQTSLREAINFANSSNIDDSTITFAPSVRGTITLQSALPDLKFAATIRGPGADKLTIARGAGTTPFSLLTLDADALPFTRPAFNATISGLSFTGGNATQGGAIYAKKANLTLLDCAFFGNTAFNGGAVAGTVQSTFVVRNSTFNSNISTHHGGGLYSLNTVTLEQCTFDGNTATDSGAGIYCPANLTLDSCTLTNNRAKSAGGTASGTGGGIYVVGASAPTVLRNNIIAGNTRGSTGSVRDDVSGAVDGASANNLIGDGTGSTGLTNGSNGNKVGTANTLIDPLLEALANNGGTTQTRALKAGSPALDAGNTDLTRDQRGMKRPQGSADDMGAFETAAANNPPQLNNETFTANSGVAFTQQLQAIDPDGDALTYTLESGALPNNLSLSASGAITGTATASGRFDFSVNVTDGKGGSTTARFIIIVTSAGDGIGPIFTRDNLESSYTRDQLAALVFRGTIRDVAPDTVTPSGVKQLLFQLRQGSTAYSGNETTGFTNNLNRGYFPAFIGTPAPNSTAGTSSFRRNFASFIPSTLPAGNYSLVILGQDNLNNFSVEVVPVTITATPQNAMSSPFGISGSGGGS